MAAKVCSPECTNHCEFDGNQWLLRDDDDHLIIGDWQYCPSCGARLLEGGETEAKGPSVYDAEGIRCTGCEGRLSRQEGYVIYVEDDDLTTECFPCVEKRKPTDPDAGDADASGEGGCKKCGGTQRIHFGEWPCPECYVNPEGECETVAEISEARGARCESLEALGEGE